MDSRSTGLAFRDRGKLDDLAAAHDSSDGLFRADRLMPMYRQIAETPCEVSFYERLYAPADDTGKLLPTINEAIHHSVSARYGKQVALCSDDARGECTALMYTPKNLAPFFTDTNKLKSGVKVAG